MIQSAIDFTAPPTHQHGERDMILEVVACKPEMFRADFCLWLGDNWHIWKAFEAEACRTWARGRRHYSARTIGEYLRHETALSERQHEFKINNNEFPCMARLFVLLNPDKPLFEFRGMMRAA